MDLTLKPAGDGWTAELADGRRFRCAIGRGGLARDKREGDGATPIGAWPMRRLLFRADRIDPAPRTGLPATPVDPADGWCDDPDDPDYNRLIRRPCAASHEVLWREDGLYDLIVVLAFNDAPPVAGAGSAIFLHCAAADFAPTAGCVALAKADLLAALPAFDPDSRVVVPG